MAPWRHRTTFPFNGPISVFVLGAALAAAPAPPAAVPMPPPEDQATADSLLALNDASRAAYRRAKQEALARTGPVILVEGDKLVLSSGGRRIEVRFTPDLYHALKAVAHVPLALDVMLGSVPEGEPLGDELLGDLRRYRGLIAGARERVRTLGGLTPAQARRQEEILSGSLGFIDAVVGSRACGRGARTGYARRMAPLVMANAADAARADLDALHRLVRHWKEGMPAGDWDRLTVLIMGRPLPRTGNLAVQYFARLLGEPGEGRRVVYAESVFDEPKALDLLATRLVDTRVGEDFFGDPARMHRDLLSDAARAYLDQLLGQTGCAAGDRSRSAAGGEATRDPAYTPSRGARPR
jgi:hypothetical protein